MAVSFSTETRDLICGLINGLASGGEVIVYDGADLSGNILVQLTLTDPAFQTPSSGTMQANPIGIGTAIASGTATSWGLYTSSTHVAHADQLIFKGTVGTDGSGADMILDTTTILVNQTTAINLLTFVSPL